MNAETLTIILTPRAKAVLDANMAHYELHRMNIQDRLDEEKRTEAAEECPTGRCRSGDPLVVPPAMTREEMVVYIIEYSVRDLERVNARVLHGRDR